MTRWKRYLIDVGPPTLFVAASITVAGVVAKRMEPGVLRIFLAMIPLPSIIWMAYTEVRRLRRRDELRQRIEVEAMTIAFLVSLGVILMPTILDLFGGMEIPLQAALLVMSVCGLAHRSGCACAIAIGPES